MCAQNGMPNCGCQHGMSVDASGQTAPGVPAQADVDGVPRFIQAITAAAPLKADVDGGYLVPGGQPGQMMTPYSGGTIALYQDIYGSVNGRDFYYFPGSWGTVHSAGRG